MDNIIKIEYCTLCRWQLRAFWMAQELMQTFPDEIQEMQLRPTTGGIYNIYLNGELLYSRQEKGRFPDIKELKQLVRDEVSPDRDLGHSDRKGE